MKETKSMNTKDMRCGAALVDIIHHLVYQHNQMVTFEYFSESSFV